MKRFTFLIGILAVLFVSCAPLATNNENVSLSVRGDQIFRKAFEDNGNAIGGRAAAGDGTVYSLTISLEGSGSTRTQTATGTESEIRGMTFSFDEIAVGATITVSCVILRDGIVFWEGQSEPTVIKEGENNISIVMKRDVKTLSFKYESARVKLAGDTLDLRDILVVEPATVPVKWSSSNENVASVNANGVVSADSSIEPGTNDGQVLGKTTITASAGGKTATCEVYVVNSDEFAVITYNGIVPESAKSGGNVTLTKFSIPYGFKTIGDGVGCMFYMFDNSSAPIISSPSLETVIIPNSVETINSFAFSDSALKSVTIPSSVTEIRGKVFDSCSRLESVTFEDKNGWTYAIEGGSLPADVSNPSANVSKFQSDWAETSLTK